MLQDTSTDNESPNGTPKHSDKFPLTLHRTGQYCKKIRGHMYYFGKDKQKALQAYLEQATYLHTGKGRPVGDGLDLGLTLRVTLSVPGDPVSICQ